MYTPENVDNVPGGEEFQRGQEKRECEDQSLCGDENGNSTRGLSSECGDIVLSPELAVIMKDEIQKLSKEVEIKVAEIKQLSNKLECLRIQNSCDSPSVHLDPDTAYFKNYSGARVHYTMLKDRIRTEAYRDAMMRNKLIMKDKLIMDVGCGTGILSMFAVTAGARKVISVDESDIIYHTMDIIRLNGMGDKIQLVKGKIENIDLPMEEKCDIILSEWMGYFLVTESMLESIIFARDKYLKERGGIMMPSRAKLYVAGASGYDAHRHLMKFWDNVQGFKMHNLKENFIKEADLDVVSHRDIITTEYEILSIDMNYVTSEDLEFKKMFKLICIKSGELTRICGYFEVFFDLPTQIILSTSPHEPATHWKQLSFILKDPIHIKEGELLLGNIECRRDRENFRHIVVDLHLRDVNMTYYF